MSKVGRPATGIKRVSICISGQPEQIEQLKELAEKENKTVSGFIFEKCGVPANYPMRQGGLKKNS